ncbi:MAG: hypothetical protein HOW73_47775 [Polyangiaceae bacterium]|nr:hypothetical protein [Polyangiaceae bacterium]
MNPPERWFCERMRWIDRGCPKAGCPNRLRQDGSLCQYVVDDLLAAGDQGKSWGLARTQTNVAFALGIDNSRVSQIERGALVKLRRKLEAA